MNGYDDDASYVDGLVRENQAADAQKAYIEEQFDALNEEFSPVMISKVDYTDEASLDEAMKTISNTYPGDDAWTVLLNNSTDYDEKEMKLIQKSETTQWYVYKDKDNSKYYLYHLREIDPEKDKDALIATYAQASDMRQKVEDDLLEKHNFKLY
jgi:hypothetical protein